MRVHVQACLPEESCGLLGGRSGQVSLVVPATNALHSPVRFRIDPAEQLAAFQRFESLGLELVGIFHSHPGGPDGPSGTDIAEAYYPEAVTLIWHRCQGEWSCCAYTILAGEVREIQIIQPPG